MLFGAIGKALDDLARAARTMTPFGFFAHVLGARRGRQKFLARLGPEANDALDEFLNLALDYEQRETPSLQGFLAWLRAAKSEVRRDMEMARDEVRVMTVHGAKGLEANTVILADTTTPPAGAHPPKLLELPRMIPKRGTGFGKDHAQSKKSAACLGEGQGRRRRGDGASAPGRARCRARRIPAAACMWR